jgi:hypothetical protein
LFGGVGHLCMFSTRERVREGLARLWERSTGLGRIE